MFKLSFLFVLIGLVGACTQTPANTGFTHLHWVASKGGLSSDACAADEANAAIARLTCNSQNLHIHVLNDEALVAYSFPDGDIYVARGLVKRLTSDELAATIAHEMGHLLHDGIIQAPSALRGMAVPANGTDIETAADLLGREVLVSANISPSSLTSALEKVAHASRGDTCYASLCSRVAYLRSLDAAGR